MLKKSIFSSHSVRRLNVPLLHCEGNLRKPTNINQNKPWATTKLLNMEHGSWKVNKIWICFHTWITFIAYKMNKDNAYYSCSSREQNTFDSQQKRGWAINCSFIHCASSLLMKLVTSLQCWRLDVLILRASYITDRLVKTRHTKKGQRSVLALQK